MVDSATRYTYRGTSSVGSVIGRESASRSACTIWGGVMLSNTYWTAISFRRRSTKNDGVLATSTASFAEAVAIARGPMAGPRVDLQSVSISSTGRTRILHLLP